MRKQDLYDFIETKTDKSTNLAYKELSRLSKMVREAAKKEFTGLDNIERILKNAGEQMEKVKFVHEVILKDYYSTNDNIRQVTNAMYFGSRTIGKLESVGDYSLKDNREDTRRLLALNYPNFLNFLDSIREEYVSIKEQIDNLETIKNELFAIIKGSRSGKDAYKNLVALNVNMSGFEDSKATLPAVKKLSVNVCVINGDC